MKQPLKSPIEKKLKEKIEKFIARTGMKPTAFGRGAVNDPNLLKRLAEDRFPTLRNVDRIEQFMRDWKCPPR